MTWSRLSGEVLLRIAMTSVVDQLGRVLMMVRRSTLPSRFLHSVILATVCGVACRTGDRGEPVKDCQSVPMEMTRLDVDTSGKGTGTVLVEPKDVSVRNLVCVAERLEREHPRWTEVRVAIFDSADAAEYYFIDWQSPGSPQLTGGARPELGYEDVRRALYVVSQSAGARYLELRLFGRQGDERYQTRINLPATHPIQCRFEVNRRCLLIAHTPVDLRYRPVSVTGDPESSRAPVTGSVRVTAIAQRDGRFSKIRVTKAVAEPADAVDFLRAVVTANLQSWRLDPAPSEDSLTVEYTFVTDRQPIGKGAVLGILGTPIVDMSSPSRVTIRRPIY